MRSVSFSENKRGISIAIFIFIFLLNYFLKIIHLGFEPFWYDEIISVKDTLLDFGHIKHEAEWDTNPPFYYYCLWVWCKLFGISEFKVRLMCVFFSSLAASTLFLYSKKHLNTLLSFGVSLLFTFHPFIFYFSHEARCYSLLLFIVIISCIVFYEFQKEPTYLKAVLLGLLNFLIIYTHYIASLVVFFQFITLLVFYRKFFKQISLCFLLSLALVLLRFTKKQFALLFSFHSNSTHETWIKLADSNDLNNVLSTFFIHPYIYILLSLLCVGSLFIYLKNRANYNLLQKSNFAFIYFTAIGSIIMFYLIGKVAPVFIDRYILFAIPFLLILLVFTLSNIHKYASLIIVPIILFESFNLKLTQPKTMDYRVTALVVKNLSGNAKPLVILQTKDITGLFAYYYDQSIFVDYGNLHKNLEKNNIYDIRTFNDLSALDFNTQNTIIFCQTFENKEDSKLIFDTFKANNFIFVTNNSVRGVKISLIKKINHL